MVRGMRSLSSSGRTMMNWPGCAFWAIRGASMLSLVTVGFSSTFCVILYMAKTPLYTILLDGSIPPGMFHPSNRNVSENAPTLSHSTKKTPQHLPGAWSGNLEPYDAPQILLCSVSRDNVMQIAFLRKKQNYVLTRRRKSGIIFLAAGQARPARHMEHAAVAHLVERHLAKVEVASSSLVGRSILWKFS